MPLVPLASYKDSLPHSTFSTLEFFLLYYWVALCNQKKTSLKPNPFLVSCLSFSDFKCISNVNRNVACCYVQTDINRSYPAKLATKTANMIRRTAGKTDYLNILTEFHSQNQ